MTAYDTKKSFIPPDNSFYHYCGETLNGGIQWHLILEELLYNSLSATQIQSRSQLSNHHYEELRCKNYTNLSFKQGARLLAVHAEFYPEHYE